MQTQQERTPQPPLAPLSLPLLIHITEPLLPVERCHKVGQKVGPILCVSEAELENTSLERVLEAEQVDEVRGLQRIALSSQLCLQRSYLCTELSEGVLFGEDPNARSDLVGRGRKEVVLD